MGHEEGFNRFLERCLAPAAAVVGMQRETKIGVSELHNLVAPRLDELPGLVSTLPGSPKAAI